jgi:hypothetical protein
MSLEIVRQVNSLYPQHLQLNVGPELDAFLNKLLEHLRAAGHQTFRVCKSPGERQVIPVGFQSRGVIGLDGKRYTCSGVSHDALWVDNKLFDVIASANNEDEPYYHDGKRVSAHPVFNEIPEHEWRPNNPPLKEPIAPPKPPTPKYPAYPPNESDVDGAGVALFSDFAQAGQAPNPQMFRFAFRVAFSWLTQEVPDLPASVTKHRREWRAILGLPPQ